EMSTLAASAKIAGKKISDERTTRANVAINDANTTKAEACLLAVFTSKKNLDETRACVQAEIRELRAATGRKEKKLLHPALLDRVTRALAKQQAAS
ncbi:unnamed protein product, partial [Prorocentrum cordatum]